MTSFLAWLAGDGSRKSSLYFTSDSRVTFADGSYRDNCVKLFCPSKSPDIFAMLGRDITFPSKALPIICEKIDQGLIPPGQATSMYGRIDAVVEELKTMQPPQSAGGDFTIFHGSRNAYAASSTFALTRHQYVGASGQWIRTDYDLECDESRAIAFDGTGREVVWREVTPLKVAIGGVSRIYFQGFCNALRSEDPDPFSGGAPQLLGLGSVGVGRHFGVQTETGLFLRGVPTGFPNAPPGTQWRDVTFQQIGPNGPQLKNRRRKLIKGKKRPRKLAYANSAHE